MKKIFLLLSIFILNFSVTCAEIVKNTIINGNIRISDETILLYGDIKLEKEYSESDLSSVVKNLYSTNFFEDVQITLEKNSLTINLKEYPFLNQLIIVGEKSNKFKDEIKKTMQLKEKRSFIKSYLARDIENIKNLYSYLGYNFSKVDARIKKIDNENYDLILEVNRGNKTKIKKINFVGNKSVRSNRLREIIASEEDKFWKVISNNTNLSENLIQLDVRLLTNYYRSNGFYNVEINSKTAKVNETGDAEITYSINEGNKYIINKIVTNVDSVFDKEIFFPLDNVYRDFIGEYYSPFKIKKLLDEIDELIADNNLQFVEHNVQETLADDKISVVFNIFEGEKDLVERIDILGNNITAESVIRGELIVDEGDPFTKLGLEKSVAELKSRNIFKDVSYEVENGSKDNLKKIKINIQEKPTGEISAGAGVGTNGGSFAVSVKENNYLGEGKQLGFNLELDKESLAGTLSYNNPNYDFLGNSIYYSLSSEKNDVPTRGYENSIISAAVSTSFEQYKDIDLTLGLTASYDDLTTLSSASTALQKQSGEFEEISANYGISYDKRDRKFMPTNGSVVAFNQTIPLYADKGSIGNTFAASNYFSFSEDIVTATKFYIATVNSIDDDVRLSKRKSLSTARLRGFEKGKIGPVDGTDHIGGNYAAALNLEANLPNFLPEDSQTDVSLFLDFGNVWGVDYDNSLEKNNKIRSSTGVSASWNSPLGPMTFVFSQALQKANTDKTESFNFNLGTTF